MYCPHCGLEGLVALQRHAHALAGEICTVPKDGATPEDGGYAQLRRRSLELLLGLDADQEHGIDASRFVGFGASDRILEAGYGHGPRASCNHQVWVTPRRQGSLHLAYALFEGEQLWLVRGTVPPRQVRILDRDCR